MIVSDVCDVKMFYFYASNLPKCGKMEVSAIADRHTAIVGVR